METEQISERPLLLSEAKEIIKKIEKRDKELSFRVNKTKEYLNLFSKEDFKKQKEVYDKLVSLNIPRLKERHIIKILDIMPTEMDEVKAILSGENLTITSENLKKVIDIVKENASN